MALKKTSSVVTISFTTSEGAANTFQQDEHDLNLDILNREVFIVLGVDLDLSEPDGVPGTNTSVNASITSTTQTSVQGIGNTNCIAHAREFIESPLPTDTGIAFNRTGLVEPQGAVPYLAIVATSDFFSQIQGVNNNSAKSMSGRLWGYRAQADASTYAALVQSEVLSA